METIPIDTPRNLAPLCVKCARYVGVRPGVGHACAAYATGVPTEILASVVDHRKPYAGDGGLIFMPPVSETQRRAMWASAAGHGTSGIPRKVGEEFANADPGGKLPAKARDLAPEKFGVIKQALGFLRDFFTEEEGEAEHGAEDDWSPEAREAAAAARKKNSEQSMAVHLHTAQANHHNVQAANYRRTENHEAAKSHAEAEKAHAHAAYTHGVLKRNPGQSDKYRAAVEASKKAHATSVQVHDANPPKGRAASVAFVCPDGRTLFVKRATDANDPHSGKWCWPGGKAEDGEDFEAAAKREALEEAGKDRTFDGMKELHQTRTERGWDHVTYTVPVDGPFEPTLSDECADHVWAHPDEAPDPLHPGCRVTLDAVLNKKPEDPAPVRPRVKPVVATRDVADPTGKLSETTREDIDSNTHREDMPASAFLLPSERKYPVKEHRDGAWKYTRNLLLGAARRARMEGRTDLARRADAIREREFGKSEDGEDDWSPEARAAAAEARKKNAAAAHKYGFSKTQPSVSQSGHETGVEHLHPGSREKIVQPHHDQTGQQWHHISPERTTVHSGNGHAELEKHLKNASYDNPKRREYLQSLKRSDRGARDTPLKPATGGWLRQSINAGSEMPAYMKSQNITSGQLSRGKAYNTGTGCDAQPADWSRFRYRTAPQRLQLAMDRALPELRLERGAGMAFDRSTARDYDAEGRLHVKDSILTKAVVNPYLGREIPDYEKLGLNPDKKYMLLRDPDELKKAVPTANGRPLLDRHRAATATDHPKELTVGAFGTNARWDPKEEAVRNDLSVWPEYASRAIEDGSQRELSMGYSYIPVMEPGSYKGHHYDGRMTQIKFNHGALVPEGRVQGATVADAMPSVWSDMVLGKTADGGVYDGVNARQLSWW